MVGNELRCGNFTASEIVALTTSGTKGAIFGKPGITYINQTNWERRLGKSIDNETSARPLSFGKLGEKRVFDILPMDYTLTSKITIQHPDIPYFVGSPDGQKFDEGGTVIDIKCPITLNSFCQLVEPLYAGLNGMEAMDYIRETHKDGEKYYYQLVANAILTKSKYAELIVYTPYREELEILREMAGMIDDESQKQYFWIAQANDDELPYLIEGGEYKNLNIIRFEVSPVDKKFLIERITEAGKKLIQRK